MNYIHNLWRIAIIAVLTLFAFGPSNRGQAAQEEADQFSCASVTEIPRIECEALIALYNGTNGPNWRNTTGWLATNTPCSWYGVTCGEGYVIELILNGESDKPFGLQGGLPSEIGNLDNLTTLDFSGNQLSSLPAEIGNLDNLTALYLSLNQLSSLPAEIGNLDNLTTLLISSNQLRNLPPKIGDLNNLTWFSLRNNQLNSLPDEFTELVNLYYLDVSGNNLINLSNALRTFLHEKDSGWAESQNVLLTATPTATPTATSAPMATGCTNVTQIPQIECKALVALYNGTNGPSWGNTTEWLATNTPCSWYGVTCGEGYVIELRLKGFMGMPFGLQGALPEEIGNLSNLTWLDLNSNMLSSLPPEIGSLNKLTRLNLSFNQLSNLPAEIGNLNSLTTLISYENQLRSIPTEIGNLNNLTTLALHRNQLRSLPTEIGNLNNLTGLYLRDNELRSLPTEIGNLNKLTRLELQYNELRSLPDELTNLVNLNHLDVSVNQLSNLSDELQAFLDEKDPNRDVSQSEPLTATPIHTSVSATATATPTSTETPTPGPTTTPEEKSWTLFIYAMGDNNLYSHLGSGSHGMLKRLKDLNRQVEAGVQVVVMLDGPDIGDSSYYLLSEAGHWTTVPLTYEAGMDERGTLEDFLKWGFEQYGGSDYNSLAILGHATGILGMGPDDSSDATGTAGYLEPEEIRDAIRSVQDFGRINVVHFDGCSFGLFESASIVDGLVDYVIASPNTGWALFPYGVYRGIAGTATTPKAYGEGVAQYYATELGRQGYPYTISVFDMDHYSAVKEAVDGFGRALADYITVDQSVRAEQISEQRAQVQSYDSGDYEVDIASDLYVDLAGFAEIMADFSSPEIAQASVRVTEVLTNFISYTRSHSGDFTHGGKDFYHDLENAHGIGIFYPASRSQNSTIFTQYTGHDLYRNLTVGWGWTDFITNGLSPTGPEGTQESEFTLVAPLIPRSLSDYKIFLPMIVR